MAGKLTGDCPWTRTDPDRPAGWENLGSSAGWIVNETRFGLQWWTTAEEDWSRASKVFGSHRLERDEGFSSWYRRLLGEWSARLKTSFEVEDIYWRRMDLPAVGRRPSVRRESWRRVDITVEDAVTWRLILPETFLNRFDPGPG